MLNPITLHLYNTETRQKEKLTALQDNHIKMYTCGPTVYNTAHIGNFRTYIFEDLLRRTLKFFGFKITQVMNLTDVDDKTIRGAIAQNVSLDEYTQPFKDSFFKDLKTLHIEPVEFYPAATDYIPEMIQMVQTLLDKGMAYQGRDKSIYYAIARFPRYGCLSHFCLKDLLAGASERISSDEYDKENAADFVLWKSYDETRDGQIYWDSPFGPGRPGWHLECSAMAMKILGETLDIHVGGVDNMFPHHENEIAQSEGCSGKQFAKLWMHAEHLLVDHKKMSKSLNNFYKLQDLLDKGYLGVHVRYLLLQTHYKTPLNFTFQALEASKNSLKRLNDFIQRLYLIKDLTYAHQIGQQNSQQVSEVSQFLWQRFTEALADDLNISVALSAVFDFVREINAFCDQHQLSQTEAKQVLDLMEKIDSVLGILNFEKQEEEIPLELKEAFEKRLKARKEKNWKQSDELRDFIYQKGYLIEDTSDGARLIKAN